MAYMLRRGRDDMGRKQTVYLSKSTGRVYYRDAQTKQAIWLSSPNGKTARCASSFRPVRRRNFASFRATKVQSFGRTLLNNRADPAAYTPKIKVALGANATLSGSQINVDTMTDGRRIILRGTVVNNEQRIVAEALAKKNAPGFIIQNELVVQGSS